MWTGSKTARVTGQARGETGIDPDKKQQMIDDFAVWHGCIDGF